MEMNQGTVRAGATAVTEIGPDSATAKIGLKLVVWVVIGATLLVFAAVISLAVYPKLNKPRTTEPPPPQTTEQHTRVPTSQAPATAEARQVQPSNEPELLEVGCFKVRVGEFTDKDVLSGVGLVAAPVEFGVAWKWYINDQLFGEFDPTHDTVSQTVNSAGDRKESYILTAGRGRTEVDFVYCKYLGREPPANWYVLALHKRAKEASL